MKLSIKAARVNAGYTQKQAAAAFGISNVTLCAIEKTPDAIPSKELLDKMCKLYNVEPSMLKGVTQ